MDIRDLVTCIESGAHGIFPGGTILLFSFVGCNPDCGSGMGSMAEAFKLVICWAITFGVDIRIHDGSAEPGLEK
jgi:hypothetical protein